MECLGKNCFLFIIISSRVSESYDSIFLEFSCLFFQTHALNQLLGNDFSPMVS